jgi:glutathionylspermidine synthase
MGIYPKEWLISEQKNYQMKQYDWKNLKSFEPFWKLILGNKALLPLLWSMYPEHPNLLPAFYDDPKSQLGASEFSKKYGNTKWVSKPIFGREGMGVFFSSNFSNYDLFVKRTNENFGKDPKTHDKLGQSIF